MINQCPTNLMTCAFILTGGWGVCTVGLEKWGGERKVGNVKKSDGGEWRGWDSCGGWSLEVCGLLIVA